MLHLRLQEIDESYALRVLLWTDVDAAAQLSVSLWCF